jgi:hypothetical protein
MVIVLVVGVTVWLDDPGELPSRIFDPAPELHDETVAVTTLPISNIKPLGALRITVPVVSTPVGLFSVIVGPVSAV